MNLSDRILLPKATQTILFTHSYSPSSSVLVVPPHISAGITGGSVLRRRGVGSRETFTDHNHLCP